MTMRSHNLARTMEIFDWLRARRTNFGASIYAARFEIGIRTAHRDFVVLEGGGWIINTDPSYGVKNTWQSLLYEPSMTVQETTPGRLVCTNLAFLSRS